MAWLVWRHQTSTTLLSCRHQLLEQSAGEARGHARAPRRTRSWWRTCAAGGRRDGDSSRAATVDRRRVTSTAAAARRQRRRRRDDMADRATSSSPPPALTAAAVNNTVTTQLIARRGPSYGPTQHRTSTGAEVLTTGCHRRKSNVGDRHDSQRALAQSHVAPNTLPYRHDGNMPQCVGMTVRPSVCLSVTVTRCVKSV